MQYTPSRVFLKGQERETLPLFSMTFYGDQSIAEVLYKMDHKLKLNLANALRVEPAEIMDYVQKEDGTYTVILFSFQKYTGIIPEEDSFLPIEYRKAYANPNFAKKGDLVEIAEILDLKVDGDLRKDYIAAVQAHRNR